MKERVNMWLGSLYANNMRNHHSIKYVDGCFLVVKLLTEMYFFSTN